MKYLSKIWAIAAVAVGFAACSDGLEDIALDSQQQGDIPVNVTFSFADRSMQTRSKVSGEETKVTVMQMVCFDASGLYLGIRNAEVESDNATPDTGKIKGSVPQGTARIHFIANRSLTVPLSHTVGTPEETVMQSEELSTIWNDTVKSHRYICYWGYHKEANEADMKAWLKPISATSKVYMIRDRAKVVLSYNPDGASVPVTKIEWLIHNGRERGYLAPKSTEWENYHRDTTITVSGTSTNYKLSKATMNEYTKCLRYSLWRDSIDNDSTRFDVAYDSTDSEKSDPLFLFDDNNEDIDNVKVILRVTYTVDGSPKTVYHTLRLNDDDKNKYDIVRNNTYYIQCKLLSPDVAFYGSLKEAIDGEEFVNADVEVDRTIPDINDNKYSLQIKLPTETTSIVLNTAGDHSLDFVLRLVNNIDSTGSTKFSDYDIHWEKPQSFCNLKTDSLTYNPTTKQFSIHVNVPAEKLTTQLQDEWLVVQFNYTDANNKKHSLKRYIHVFVIDQFRYKLYPKLTQVGADADSTYMLSFTLPPVKHTQFLDSAHTQPDPNELIYPAELYPIDVKFTTNTLNAYNTQQSGTNYGLFGVSIEGTSQLCDSVNFEVRDEAPFYHTPISSTDWADRTHWYFQQENNYWDFWYTYSLKTYPNDGVVNIYFKDVRDHIKYATVQDVGLFLYVQYFGKNYSVHP